MTRVTAHWRVKSIREHRDFCHAWVRKLLSLGLTPNVVILEECLAGELNAIEMFWIASVRAAGGKLLNMTDGGEGTRGFRWSPEAKKQIGNHHKGKRLSEVHLAALSRATKGITHSAVVSERRAARLRGRPATRQPPSKRGKVPWNKGITNSFQIINEIDGQRFSSARKASSFYGIAYGTVRGLLCGRRIEAYPMLRLRLING
jgi:hypothetical protein